MNVAKTPKLLFHGTAALPAYLSYRVGRQLAKLQRQNPEAARRITNSPRANEFFPDFGPGYPCTGKATTTYDRDICLADNLAGAYSFTHYQAKLFDRGNIQLENSSGRQITLTWQHYTHFPEVQEFLMKFTEHLYKSPPSRSSFPTYGAILLIDGQSLETNGLLIDRETLIEGRLWHGEHLGEESHTAGYLPWKFIRGILFVQPAPAWITSFWFRDRQIQNNLIEYLEGSPHYKGLMSVIPCYEQIKSSVPWQTHL